MGAHVCAQRDDGAERLARGNPVSHRFQRGPDHQCRRHGREALAAEHKGKITVNAVLPSTIDTAANRASMPKADFGKWVAPKELADVILFLASDAASAVTGALLPVSGRV
jgi:hypothetical protein